jgi:hypothetical protein
VIHKIDEWQRQWQHCGISFPLCQMHAQRVAERQPRDEDVLRATERP